MSDYRSYPPSNPRLIGYDPALDLQDTHLARLVDKVVEATIVLPPRVKGQGNPPFDPRLCLKVLIYSYCIGVRSSRQMERFCSENLPFLFLTRGDTPSYRTLCSTRVHCTEQVELVWQALFAIASELEVKRMGRITVDSSKFRANASPESVVKQDEYDAVRAELVRIQEEVAAADTREDQEGAPTKTILEKGAQDVSSDQMRDILRRVRTQQAERKRKAATEAAQREKYVEAQPLADKTAAGSVSGQLTLEAPPESPVSEDFSAAITPSPTPQMLASIERAISSIDVAKAKRLKHLCLTDPDARMLGEGRSKQLKECYSFEVAVDNGLIVAAGVTTEHDSQRLTALVQQAQKNEPEGVTSIDADSGYWRGDDIAALEKAGKVTCVPTPFTACDLRRGHPVGTTLAATKGSVPFTFDAELDHYKCPEGNSLIFLQNRVEYGQTVRVYGAVRDCSGCPRAGECLKNPRAKRRSLRVAVHREEIQHSQERFEDPGWQERYHERAPAVETLFGFIRGTLCFSYWLLRGSKRVSCEATLFKTAYQLRKVHSASSRKIREDQAMLKAAGAPRVSKERGSRPQPVQPRLQMV